MGSFPESSLPKEKTSAFTISSSMKALGTGGFCVGVGGHETYLGVIDSPFAFVLPACGVDAEHPDPYVMVFLKGHYLRLREREGLRPDRGKEKTRSENQKDLKAF